MDQPRRPDAAQSRGHRDGQLAGGVRRRLLQGVAASGRCKPANKTEGDQRRKEDHPPRADTGTGRGVDQRGRDIRSELITAGTGQRGSDDAGLALFAGDMGSASTAYPISPISREEYVMTTFEQHEDINAPVETVWSILANAGQWPLWFPGIEGVTNLSGVDTGATFQFQSGGETNAGTITRVNPNQRLEVTTQHGGH